MVSLLLALVFQVHEETQASLIRTASCLLYGSFFKSARLDPGRGESFHDSLIFFLALLGNFQLGLMKPPLLRGC